jgi:hypothetical protein
LTFLLPPSSLHHLHTPHKLTNARKNARANPMQSTPGEPSSLSTAWRNIENLTTLSYTQFW